MKRLAVVLALLLAGEAGAVTLNVTNDATMTTANTTAVAGDLILIADGPYTVAINPTNNGTGAGARITYVGDILNPNNVIMPGFDLTKSWVTVKGCSLTTGATFRSSNDGAQQTNDSLAYCRILGGMYFGGVANMHVTSVRVQGTCRIEASSEQTLKTHRTTNPIFTDITQYDPLITDYEYLLMMRYCQGGTFTRCTFRGTTSYTAQEARGWFMFHADNNTLTDCRWDFEAEDGAEVTLRSQLWVTLRDSSMWTTMNRCTLYAGLATKNSRGTVIAASGTVGQRNDYWTITNCIFKAFGGTNVNGIEHPWLIQDYTDGWTIKNSQFISRTGEAIRFSQSPDSMTFHHNTVYSGGNAAMVWFGGSAGNPTGGTAARFTGNTFVAKPADLDACTNCRRLDINRTVIVTTGTFPSVVNAADATTFACDSNLVYSYTVPSAPVNANKSWLCMTSHICVYAPTDAAWNHDTRSLWAAPSFVDTTWATLNLSQPSGVGVGTRWPQQYVGHSNTLVDAVRPAATTPLTVTASGSSAITLQWTSVGNDSLTGTATAYDIRYSTANITSANFASAAQAPSMPTPSIAGTVTSFAVTGLTASTIYFFALKTTDGTTLSAISDTARCGTGVSADVTPPVAIVDLSATVTGATTIDLRWGGACDTGDPGGAVSSYTIKRSTANITSANFDAATTVTYTGPIYGCAEQETEPVTGLTAATAYYFAIKSTDYAGNVSTISNVPSATTQAAVDVTAPGMVTSVAVVPQNGQVIISWVASGNDGATGGAATSFDIRYVAGASLVEGGWAAATQVTGEPTPGQPGTAHSMTVTGLSNGTQYAFAIKALDAAPNTSTISSSVTGTPAAPVAQLTDRNRR